MSEWREIMVDEACCRLSSGKSISSSLIREKGTYPVYGGNGIRGFTNKYNFDGECAIIGRQGASCGNVRYFSGKAYMTEHAVVAVPTEEHNAYYLSCVLASLKLGRLSGQSAQPGIGVGLIGRQIITMPSLPTQKKTASILSSLDDKIAVNRRICENLEAQAQALFKHWFIDFAPFKNGKFVESELGMIPERWRVGSLEELVDIKYGKDHKKLNEGNIPAYGSAGLMRTVDEKLYDGESVLIPRKGTLNNIMYVNEAFWTVDTMFYTIPKKSNILKYIYMRLKRIDFNKMNVGTSIPSNSTSQLNKLKIVVPTDEILNHFDGIMSSLLQEIIQSQKESKGLITLRDTLLPKLMSGQIKV